MICRALHNKDLQKQVIIPIHWQSIFPRPLISEEIFFAKYPHEVISPGFFLGYFSISVDLLTNPEAFPSCPSVWRHQRQRIVIFFSTHVLSPWTSGKLHLAAITKGS